MDIGAGIEWALGQREKYYLTSLTHILQKCKE